MKAISLPLHMLKKLGFGRTLVLCYVQGHAEPNGWCRVGKGEYDASEYLSVIKLSALYRFLHMLKGEEYLELQYDQYTGVSFYRITRKGQKLIKESD